jgi:cellulose synthase/poly-beta-1,6-N-acetylglucosamine synthase-like glycosyltransferase
MIEALFWASALLVVFAYFGYPISLSVVRLVRKKSIAKSPTLLDVTVIVTAFNEETRIGKKLENTLELDYPSEKLQILVASDGSTDRSNEIVAAYYGRGIELLALEERRGKENAQKEAIKKARGQILLFTDVATFMGPDALKQIVFNFSDPSVGCVSSEDRLIGKDGKPTGEGFYVRYEMWLRRLESRVGSLVGLSGSFFAARREICRDFSAELQSDFGTVLQSVRMGLRGVLDREAIGYYEDIADERREFDRKIRTVLRGLTVFFRNVEFLNLFQYGLFSYQFLCHKLLRWLVPFFMGVAFLSSLILSFGSLFFMALFLAQVGFYGLALWGWSGSEASSVLLKIPTYFVRVNASILVAWWRYLQGQRIMMWTPSER